MSFIQLLGRGKPLPNSFYFNKKMFQKNQPVSISIGAQFGTITGKIVVTRALNVDETASLFQYEFESIADNLEPEVYISALKEFGFDPKKVVVQQVCFYVNNDFKHAKGLHVWYVLNDNKKSAVVYENGNLYFVSLTDAKETASMMHAKLYSHLPDAASKKAGKETFRVNMITGDPDNLSVSDFRVPKRNYTINSEHYLPGFDKFHTDVKEWIKSDETGLPGLAIMYGPPGTGKSTLIKSLMSYAGTDARREVFYITPSFAESLASPNVVPLLAEYEGAVLVIEDAESILKLREGGDTSAVSTLLNLTDGVLGDMLNFKIICTFNTELDLVDPALLRPGRLHSKHYFGELPPEQVKRINPALSPTDFMSLAEVFNTP
jgi:ATPase family associated with various cellular activities (AAA)